MPNRNYVKGRQFEYRVITYLRKLGYYCLRAYGSKGLYDIIAIPPTLEKESPEIPTPLMIQAKSNGYIHPKELQKIKDSHTWDARPLIAYKENRKLKFRTLNGNEVLI